ncbi:CMP/dCMP deaminase zinc-binding protein [Halorubrum coriense DSM 10284]|uniref:CMP/dCMP deaminase zinc-binding protein n=1 Tax=Halorubrum coriense DSM 10284 TaxID=1227466 RepID=M0EL63_9EURY|nr:nucleoside deaminase [Halorubrum coriense]ELZ47154.1 CMP/dCMP deaminase zinc-binding protein [Halorubrum coriense DSM 10284]
MTDADHSGGDEFHDLDDLPADPTDREYVERTIRLAEEAVEAGNTPFGALLVVDGEVVGEARNETRTEDDVAAHPELTLARWAARELDADELADCTMYASTEPCPMCATAIHYAGIDRVVFGVDNETLGELSDAGVAIPLEEVIQRGDGETTVEGPIAVDAAMAVHDDFFGES